MANGELKAVVNYTAPDVGSMRACPFSLVLSAIPFNVDFRALQGSDLDGTPFRPSGVYVDNSAGTGDLVITIGELNYRIICPAGGVLNIPYPAPTYATLQIVGLGQASIIFVDYPVQPFLKVAAVAQILWGQIGGTLSNQGDLQTALNVAANTAIWGSISGSISSQTDLVAALAAKANIPGAWTPLPLVTGFTGTANMPPAYRQSGDCIQFRGRIVSANAIAAGANIQFAQLPAGINPPFNQQTAIAPVVLNAVVMMIAATSGSLNINPQVALAANQLFDINGNYFFL